MPPLWVQSTNRLNRGSVFDANSLTPPPPFGRYSLAKLWLSWPFTTNLPSFFHREFSNTRMTQTARPWVRTVNKRNTRNVIVFVVNRGAQNGVACAVLEDVTDCDVKFLAGAPHLFFKLGQKGKIAFHGLT